jgi:hypothetical protein
MHRLIRLVAPCCAAAAALILTGCGGNGVTGPTAPVTQVTASAAAPGARAGLQHFNDPGAINTGGNGDISCPTDAPRVFHAGVFGLRMDFQWQPVANVLRYEVQVERLTGGNQFESVTTQAVTDGQRVEIYGQAGSTYRLRVRSATCVPEGSWSDWFLLSVDDPEQPGNWDDDDSAANDDSDDGSDSDDDGADDGDSTSDADGGSD